MARLARGPLVHGSAYVSAIASKLFNSLQGNTIYLNGIRMVQNLRFLANLWTTTTTHVSEKLDMTSGTRFRDQGRTSGLKDAQARTSGFKDANYVISSTLIRVFGPPQYSYFHASEKLQKAISGQRSFYSPFNARKRRQKHELLARSRVRKNFN